MSEQNPKPQQESPPSGGDVAVVEDPYAWMRRQPRPSLSLDLREVKPDHPFYEKILETLEAVDGFAALRNGLRKLAEERGDWAGIPMPIQDCPLVIERTYPNAAALMEIHRERDPDADKYEIVNVWWSRKWRCNIYVICDGDRIFHVKQPNVHAGTKILNIIGASYAWGIEQEAAAVRQLAGLVRHHTFKHYMLTGSFMERSPRSNLVYVFRKLRPTLVMSEDLKSDEMRWLCALCLHPIGYYENSWAGAMCPTDDVIAHLMLMRGDEHMFWKRANQIPMHRPEAGL